MIHYVTAIICYGVMEFCAEMINRDRASPYMYRSYRLNKVVDAVITGL